MEISGNVFPTIGLLTEAGIENEVVLCNIMEGQHKTPEFLKMCPMHCIPTMDDDGFTLWESKAILRYICNKHKLEQWYPSDVKARAITDLALDFLGNSFVKVVGNKVLYPAAGFAGPVSADDLKAAEAEFNSDLVPALKHLIARTEGPLIGGTKPSIADIAFMGYLHPIMLKCPDSFPAKNADVKAYYEASKAAFPKFAEWTKTPDAFWGAK